MFNAMLVRVHTRHMLGFSMLNKTVSGKYKKGFPKKVHTLAKWTKAGKFNSTMVI